jgi:hypothetical protein
MVLPPQGVYFCLIFFLSPVLPGFPEFFEFFI